MYIGFTSKDWDKNPDGSRHVTKKEQHYFKKEGRRLVNMDEIIFPKGKCTVDRVVIADMRGREIMDVLLTVPKRLEPGDTALIPPGSLTLYFDDLPFEKWFALTTDTTCSYCGFENFPGETKCKGCAASIALINPLDNCKHCGGVQSVDGVRCATCGTPRKLSATP